MNSDESVARRIAWGPWLVVAVGTLLLLLGVARYFTRHHFAFRDALYCSLAVVPAWLLLLIFDYTLHHAKLVSVLVLIWVALLLFSSPVWDVALGLALMGTALGPALTD